MVLRQLSGSDVPDPGSTGAESVPADPGSAAESGTVADAADATAPLSVCVLSYRSEPYSGGQGVYVRYLTRALARRGHDVTVVSGEPYPDLDPAVDLVKLPGENVVDEVDRLRAFEFSYLRDPTKLFEWASAVTGGFPDPYTFGRRAADYLDARGETFDVVHDNQSLCYGLLDVDLPTVATIHHPITADREIALAHADGAIERLLTRRWFCFLGMQRRVAGELPHLVSVSRATKERTVADFGADPGAVSVVHNGIDTELFRPLPDVDERPNRVMTTVSADVPLKGTRYLLEAFATLRESRPDAELVIVGEFDEGGTADELVGDLGIRDAISTDSEISDERMVELYASSAVAAVPSLYEGFGLPAAEAMACGVAPVATTGGALPEVVGDAGRLVPPGDADAMAAALDDLLGDPAARERLGDRARERVTRTFDWDETARETVAVYRQAIDAHR
jgi:glycosyltransferase involved in cell wall biosynthesis